jgi:predicted nucleotidyltransferase component of viral defense system
MIPELFIEQWKSHTPWIGAHQVEQYLILCRALIEIYSHPLLAQKLAFRGGTALHKVHLKNAARYSEDLDFLQIEPEPIGPTFDALRSILDPWLGEPRRELKEGLVKLLYRYRAESDGRPMKLKVEINSREHFAAKSTLRMPFKIQSEWFTATAEVISISLDWLLGSNLRALYQRRRGRDLFDLYLSLQSKLVDAESIVRSFQIHLNGDGAQTSRAEFEKNLYLKLSDSVFLHDLPPLLSAGAEDFDLHSAHALIAEEILSRLPGHPWNQLGEEEERLKRKKKAGRE